MAGGESGKQSDLGVRTLSAIIMVAVAGAALWLGGWVWLVFVAVVANLVWFEWRTLVLGFTAPGASRAVWTISGFLYCAIAAATLVMLRDGPVGVLTVLVIVGAVIGTDIGAYFAGRAIGGPKIAPKISPSKTWAGLGGGIVGATLAIGGIPTLFSHPGIGQALVDNGGSAHDTYRVMVHPFGGIWQAALGGTLVAVLAQAGDFFESWMKRRADVKDSGTLIPGHGGAFDRVDGLLAVVFAIGIALAVSRIAGIG